MRKTAKLKNLINSKKLEFIMEAHNGLSAKIVEESGFKGIWASGLTISAALGVRDSNEASWTQILEVLEFMSDNTSIPILLDGDTGYGNFNNVRRLVKKLEQRQIAGVCIEDKLFPKTNSFISGETQPLADIDEFCGKIKAAKDIQQDPDFVVVARVESFIAGWGLSEAIRRAEAYRKAGADAILVHSKKSDASDIEAFMKEWGNRHPVIIVPTKYYSVSTDKFRDLGINLVVWANQTLRSSITVMQKTVKQIFHDQSLINVEDKIVSVADVFRLQDNKELEMAEKKYLPSVGKNVNAIILAASQGKEFGELTREIPKTLLKVSGKTILSHQIDALNQIGIKDITVVRGFAKEKVIENNIKTIDNDDFANTTELHSFCLAKDKIQENTFIIYGDLVFKNYILNDLLNDGNDITIIVDADKEESGGDYHEYVKTDVPYSKKNFFQPIRLKKISSNLKKEERCGEFIGIFKVNKRGAEIINKTLGKMSRARNFRKLRMKDLFSEIVKTNPIFVKFIKGSWLDINTIVDLQKAGEF
jgi:phosphoenolpyruvate phosphomutase